MIDKSGKWVIEPKYDYINNPKNGFRIVQLNDKYGAIGSTLQISLPIEYDGVECDEAGFLLRTGYDSEGNIVQAKCEMNSYEVAGHYGLMDENGKMLTKPLYTSIEGISKNVFVCDLGYGGVKLTINDKGEVIQ